MTDEQDTCGHPTADGGECQHPATDGDSCWLNEHGGDADPSGRDWAISEDDHDDILQAAREGFSKAGCARAAGVGKATLARYLDAHDEFRNAFMRARHHGERVLVQAPLRDDPDESTPDYDGQHARFLLSTSFDYIKTEKKEVEMDADVDHKGGVTADFVAFTEDDADE